MNNLFNQGKKVIEDKFKKIIRRKIMLVLAGIAGTLTIVFFFAIIANMSLAGFISALNNIEAFVGKVGGVFEKLSYFITNINDTTIKAKETAFKEYLNDRYLIYYNEANIEIDAPLIASAVYYPLNIAYDEDTYICLNGANGDMWTPEQVEKACKKSGFESKGDLYDYWVDKKKHLGEVIRHGVVQVITTYKCDKVTTKNDAGKEEIYYVQGDQEGEPEREKPFGKEGVLGFLAGANSPDFPLAGDFPQDEVCESPKSIKKYTYEWDEKGFDEYLKNTYIPESPEFKISKNLSDEKKETRLTQIVNDIHNEADVYYDWFERPEITAQLYGNIPYDIIEQLKVPIGRGLGSDGKNDYRITSCFQSYRELTGRAHQGIDLNTRGSDKNIYAATDGVVVKIVNAFSSEFNCYKTCKTGQSEGNSVKLRHEINGTVFYTKYFHLSSVNANLKVGDIVTSSTTIGVIGNTGNSTAEHLHFQYEDVNNNPLNPGNLFTNAYLIKSDAGCSSLSVGCASRNASAAISPSYGKWNGTLYPISVIVNGNSPIPLEQYILGVTLNEMPSDFYYEALRAQMVAARTYTFGSNRYTKFALENNQIVINMGVASQATQTFDLNKICSLSDTTQNKMIQALENTRGQILLANLTNQMFSSEYSACAANNGKITLGDGYVYKLPENIETVKAYCTMDDCNQGNGNVCGHGRGMSQYGADYLAEHNSYNYTSILTYYYNAKLGNLNIINLDRYAK